MNWSNIDNFFDKIGDAIILLVILLFLVLIGYYADWNYKKAIVREALIEYNNNK